MTRCAEFYEKWEKEPNFCPMERTMAAKINSYIAYCREKGVAFATLSLSAWFKQQRKAAKVSKHKTERFVGTEIPTTFVQPPEPPVFKILSRADVDEVVDNIMDGFVDGITILKKDGKSMEEIFEIFSGSMKEVFRQ